MDKNSDLNVGAIVQLRSGGPKMTVEEVLSSSNIRCQWFAGSKLETGVFPRGSLVLPAEAEAKRP